MQVDMPTFNMALQGQGGVIGAAWLTAADHGRQPCSPRGPEPAVAQPHIQGVSWCGCGLTGVRGDCGASLYWVWVD